MADLENHETICTDSPENTSTRKLLDMNPAVESAWEAQEEDAPHAASSSPAPNDNTDCKQLDKDLFGDLYVDPEVTLKLSEGLLEQYLPQLQQAKSSLAELTENQRILIETVQQENAKFEECDALKEVINIMTKAKTYHSKLQMIKKDMLLLHEKSAKLKKRALYIQQQKQKEALQKEAAKDRELEREKQLVAKPAKKS